MVGKNSLPLPDYQTAARSSVSNIISEEENNTPINIIHIDFKKGVKYLTENSPAQIMNKLPPEFDLRLERNPLHVGCIDIPVIDLSGLIDGCDERRLQTVKSISSACFDWGFFRIINHGIEKNLVEEMLKVVEEFFDLSLEEKMKYASDDVMSPIRYGTSLNTSKKHSLHWRDYFRHYGHPFHGSFHLWPHNPANYRNVVKKYLEEVWELTMRVGGAISEGLGLDHGYIAKSMGEGCQILAANYYPPCPEPDRTLGLAAHSDHGALTILTQNGVDGLQVKHNQDWIAVHHVPDTFVVNIGDYLEILTNGKYKSVEHRATVNARKTRISVAVGHGPEFSTTIQPAGPLVQGVDGFQFRPISYQDYISLQQSSTVRGKRALQALQIKI